MARKGQKLSAATRKRMSEAQRARFAKKAKKKEIRNKPLVPFSEAQKREHSYNPMSEQRNETPQPAILRHNEIMHEGLQGALKREKGMMLLLWATEQMLSHMTKSGMSPGCYEVPESDVEAVQNLVDAARSYGA